MIFLIVHHIFPIVICSPAFVKCENDPGELAGNSSGMKFVAEATTDETDAIQLVFGELYSSRTTLCKSTTK